MARPIDISEIHKGMVCDILEKHLPAYVKVWVFGSRADWTTRDSSDLDLALDGGSRLDHDMMSDLSIAFEESDIPYKVDVIDMNALSDSFKHIVQRQMVPF